MPVMIVLHEVYSFTHHRVHHDGDRLTLTDKSLCLVQGRDDLVHVVAVHFEGSPAEGAELSVDIAQVHDGFRGAVDLLSIPVYRGDEVVYLVGGREHDGFPVLSFIQFSVPVQGKDNIFIVIEFLTQGSPDRHAHALTERTA